MTPGAFVSLLAITVASVAVTLGTLATQPDIDTADIAVGGPMMPALAERAEDVQQVIVEYPSYRLQLNKRDGAWVAGELGGYPVKAELPPEVIASLAAMTRLEPKTDNPEWYQYIRVGGPEVPQGVRGIRIRAFDQQGDVLADTVVGRASASIGYSPLGGTFVRPFDQQQAWLVEGSLSVPSNMAGWFEQLFSLPGPEIERIAFLSGDEVLLDAREGEAGKFELVVIAPDVGSPDAKANEDEFRDLTKAAVSVGFENVRLRDSVVIGPGARKVRFVTRQGLQLDATLADADGMTWVVFDAAAAESPQAAEQAAAIRSRTERWAFALPERRLALLETPLDQLIVPAPSPTPGGPNAPLAD